MRPRKILHGIATSSTHADTEKALAALGIGHRVFQDVKDFQEHLAELGLSP